MAFDPSTVDVQHFLESLEIENVTEEGDEFRFSCPFPGHNHGDRNASAYMNAETTAFFCHGCKERGDAVYFASRVLEISPLEASKFLRQAYQPGFVNPDSRSSENEVKEIILGSHKQATERNKILSEDTFERFYVDWHLVREKLHEGPDAADTVPAPFSYMLVDRGFTADTLEEWGFGYDILTDRIVFTVRDLQGRIVGYKGRTWENREPKYLVIGDRDPKRQRYGWPCYYTGKIVFGLDRAIHIDRDIIVCEGELNAISCWQAGYAAVAINGSNFTDAQAKLLRLEANSVTLFMDSDLAGDQCIWGWHDQKGKYHPGIIAKLKDHMPIKIVPQHEDDPNSMTEDQISDLLARAVPSTAAMIRRNMVGSQ
jgi:DNA primase